MPDQMETLKAALADRYEVERKIGAGGMATVFIARDLKHDRNVAVKVLHPDLAQSVGAERFLREVQITARLQHPHILPLYDSGAAGDLLYYVMPFVEGESLADRIAREKQMSLKEAIAITKEVSQALGYAHSLGLVHRDIKPANIMLTSGHAIVADFGIARAVDVAGAEKLTQTGMAVGTPAYMSPEQAAGDEVDRRSDLYSLGCVLYEMLVGQVPFTGPSAMAIIARHSMDSVPPPTIMRDAIPDDLEDVLMKVLAKTPADRFQTGAEFTEALDAVDVQTAVHRRPSAAHRRTGVSRAAARTGRPPWIIPAVATIGAVALVAAGWAVFRGRPAGTGGGGGGLSPKTVAVLYFEDQSPGHQLGFLADGLTEGLIHALNGVPGLVVISSNGTGQFRGSTAPRDSIARALGAGSLIVGAVERAGQQVRVTTRLVDGESGADLNRASLVLPATEAITVLDSVSRDVSRILRARLGEEVRLRETRGGTRNVDAWTHLQQAERRWKDARALAAGADTAATLRTFREADSLAARAVDLDPKWVAPLVARGWIAYDESHVPKEKAQRIPTIRAGLDRAERALSLAPGDAGALEVRGALRYWHWRQNVTPDPIQQARLLSDAQADLEASGAADPSRATAYSLLSSLYYAKKDNFSAVMAARRAYEADAFLSNADGILFRLFWTHYDLEQFTDATRWCTEGARRFPRDSRFAECQLWLMISPALNPDVPRAWELSRKLAAITPAANRDTEDRLGRLIVGGVIGRAGLLDSARHVLLAARATQELDPTHELEGYEAVMRVLIGDKDEAVALLRRYVALNPGHSFNVDRELHWWWRPLRDHPGFRAVTAPSQP